MGSGSLTFLPVAGVLDFDLVTFVGPKGSGVGNLTEFFLTEAFALRFLPEEATSTDLSELDLVAGAIVGLCAVERADYSKQRLSNRLVGKLGINVSCQ